MCGLFGYIGKGCDAGKIAALAVANDSRGGDAAGVFTHERGIVKAPVPAARLFRDKKAVPMGSGMVIGHTRMGTHGRNTQQNAHPFKYGSIVGTHNGVISNYADIARTYGYAVPDVDSEAIFMALSAESGRPGWASAIPQMRGGMAIAFTDGDLLHLYRRDNPIHIGYADNGVYYSSIAKSLKDVGIEPQELPAKSIFSVDSKMVWESVPVDDNNHGGMNWTDFARWDDHSEPFGAGFIDHEAVRYAIEVMRSRINDRELSEAADFLEDYLFQILDL